MKPEKSHAMYANRFHVIRESILMRISFGEAVNGVEPEAPFISVMMTKENAVELRDVITKLLIDH